MGKKIFIVSILLAAIAALGWVLFAGHPVTNPFFDASQNVLSPEIKNTLENGEHFYLLSLDPESIIPGYEPASKSAEKFHEYFILGKAEIKDTNVRSDLLHALYQGITSSDGSVANCFNPRHGLSVTRGTNIAHLVICFECRSIEIYSQNGRERVVLTTPSPLKVFNNAVTLAGLPLPPK